MRFYSITLTDPKTGAMARQWTNANDPGGLLIEMDVMVAAEHSPVGNSYIRIWGVSLQDIGQASNFNGMAISVSGGMQKGLPLANPAQAGLLFQGTVNQAFGNWQGTSQSIDLLVVAAPPVIVAATQQSVPLNLAFHWKRGTDLSDAIAATLKAALPTFKQDIAIDSSIVYTEDCAGYYWTLTQFAGMLNKLTKSIKNSDDYAGVNIVVQGQTITVTDGTSENVTVQALKPIAFTDLVGQPTWIGPQEISVKCVMRGDIKVGANVRLPKGQITTSAASLSQFRDGSVFQGKFFVASVRHVGNSRQPDANSWVTVLDLFVQGPSNGG